MALKASKAYRKQEHLDEIKKRGCWCCVRSEKARMKRDVKFPGISEELEKIIYADMDFVAARRTAREAFKDIQLSIDHILFKMPHEGLTMNESIAVNSRGLEIFSKSWLPKTNPPKAVVCLCHGYGDTCTFFLEGVARKIASSGYAVFGMDYPGFGLSEGLHGFISSFDQLVDDVIEQYSKVKENPDLCKLPSFLFGESMGGAVALKVHLKQPSAWSGAILCAPMCKIADDMVPPWALTQILIGVAKLLPKHKLIPQKDLADLAFKDPKKREQTAYNVISYNHKPRLRTGVEMLNTTQEIEQQLGKVSLPLLILHGKADVVTDPSVSNLLYQKAISNDKKVILYDDAWHSLLAGETDETILKVFSDIITWLDMHSR